jgi:HTH-type transcriptional regulator / antitoxin HipB
MKMTDRSQQAVAVSSDPKKLPIGNSESHAPAIHSSAALGAIVREQRRRLGLTQLDIAGLGNTGNRFIVELESGKPTVQLQKVLEIMDLLGLELIVRAKAARSA